MPNTNYYAQLSPVQKAELFKLYAASGFTSLSSIIDDYNKFAEGGDTDIVEEYHDEVDYPMWGYENIQTSPTMWYDKFGDTMTPSNNANNVAKKSLLQKLSDATIRASIAENPAVMTASGQRIDRDGSVSFDHQDDPGVKQLRENLVEIGTGGLTAMGLNGLLTMSPAADIQLAKAGLQLIDYTSPSHWAIKAAAKAGASPVMANSIGLLSDMYGAAAVPAAKYAYNMSKVKNNRSISEDQASDIVSELRRDAIKEGLTDMIPTIISPIAGYGINKIAGAIRRGKQIARIKNAKTLGNFDGISDRLIDYHSSSDIVSKHAAPSVSRTPVKIDDSLIGSNAGGVFHPSTQEIGINPMSLNLQLGKEYTNALIAHEGNHAYMYMAPITQQISVPKVKYDGPNLLNPRVTPQVADIFDRNDPLHIGTWKSSPEEFTSELAFLRELTGQNKRYEQLNPIYKASFEDYLSKRFDFKKPETRLILNELGQYYDNGGQLIK